MPGGSRRAKCETGADFRVRHALSFLLRQPKRLLNQRILPQGIPPLPQDRRRPRDGRSVAPETLLQWSKNILVRSRCDAAIIQFGRPSCSFVQRRGLLASFDLKRHASEIRIRHVLNLSNDLIDGHARNLANARVEASPACPAGTAGNGLDRLSIRTRGACRCKQIFSFCANPYSSAVSASRPRRYLMS